MQHHKKHRSLGRKDNARAALLRDLLRALILDEKITTTLTKAKEIRPRVEKLITKGKSDTLASRRLIASRLGSSEATKKLVDDISKKYEKRAGGYTRITKLGTRSGDAAEMAVIEFV